MKISKNVTWRQFYVTNEVEYDERVIELCIKQVDKDHRN
jgi:hypothetical protein